MVYMIGQVLVKFNILIDMICYYDKQGLFFFVL